MRSLIEWKLGKIGKRGDVHMCTNTECHVCRVFGTTAGDVSIGPTRLIVRDAHIKSTVKLEKMRRKLGLLYVENKTENSINRLTARANPRTQERVPAGTEFDFEMVYRIFALGDKGDKDKELYSSVVETGLKLLQMDALGGSGSRGYGKIKIETKTEDIPLSDNGKEGD